MNYRYILISGILLLFVSFGAVSGEEETERDAMFRKLAQDSTSLQDRSRILRSAAELVEPSVVHLQSSSIIRSDPPSGSDGTRRVRRLEETGSGVIVQIEKKFFVLTNRHVVAEIPLNSIDIHLSDRRVLQPINRRSNYEFDLALLEIEAEKLLPARIGNSDSVDVADTVLVLGSPFGLSWSVSVGVISAKDRRRIPINNQPNPLVGFFQTDSAINPGNSGGPMINTRGEVIGIVTAIASGSGSNEGVAFAIPINPLMRRAEELVRTGRITRPYIGMELDPKFDLKERQKLGLERNIGTRVMKVLTGSPAAEAGIVPGDVILRYEGTEVEDDLHLINLIAEAKGGDSPKIVLLRNGKYFESVPKLRLQESR